MASNREVLPGQIYRHFKNNLYQIVCVALHSETGEKLVIYQKLYDDYKVHARPYDMFLSEVDHQKYPEVTQKYRFELVETLTSVQTNEIIQKLSDNSEVSTDDATLNETVEEKCNNDLLNFLEAETYEEKHNLLVSMKPRMTDRLIDDIAASMDVIVDKGDLNTRFKSLLVCVDTKAKFEIMR